MTINKKITGGVSAGLAAVVTAASVLTPGTIEVEGTYNIQRVNSYCSQISFDMPENFTPDIVALKLNDIEIGKTLLPKGHISTLPPVLSDTNALSLDLYVRGEKAGTASFGSDGTLDMEVNEKYLNDVTAEETDTEENSNEE